jgi:hypothetical protein
LKNSKNNLAMAAAALLSAASLPAGAAQDTFTLTAGFDYSSGKYGDTEKTDILYIPFTGKYETGRWLLKLTVPYIRITGPGNVVRDIGVIRPAGATVPRTTESGLGDVVAAATYNVYAQTGHNPLLVDLTGKIKFGTADDTKGLGTGKNDYALQVDLYKTIDNFTPFATVGYKWLGSPAGTSLNNVAYGSLGGSYKLSPKNSAGLIFDFRQKASAAGAPQRELTAFVTHRIDKDWKAQGYVVKGFSDGSPDWGLGALASYAF